MLTARKEGIDLIRLKAVAEKIRTKGGSKTTLEVAEELIRHFDRDRGELSNRMSLTTISAPPPAKVVATILNRPKRDDPLLPDWSIPVPELALNVDDEFQLLIESFAAGGALARP